MPPGDHPRVGAQSGEGGLAGVELLNISELLLHAARITLDVLKSSKNSSLLFTSVY